MKITKQMLERADACSEQVGVFAREWPNGADVTVKNVRRAQELGLNVYWAAENIHPHWYAYKAAHLSHEAAYWAACQREKDAYTDACRPHWADYVASTQPHLAARAADCRPHWADYEAACKSHKDAYVMSLQSHLAAYQIARAEAFVETWEE